MLLDFGLPTAGKRAIVGHVPRFFFAHGPIGFLLASIAHDNLASELMGKIRKNKDRHVVTEETNEARGIFGPRLSAEKLKFRLPTNDGSRASVSL